MMSNDIPILVRRAVPKDAIEISRLCSQLGYQASDQEILQRINQLQRDDKNLILIAQAGENSLAGWMHAMTVQVLESPVYVEIGGIVVDEKYRRQGIGLQLISGAEQWALSIGINCIRLRSNVIRPEAHHFYPAIGYTPMKTQVTYQKILET